MLDTVLNHAPDSVQVIDPDSGEYLYVNDAAVRLYGLSREVMMERGVMWVTRYLHIWTEEQQCEQFRKLIELSPKPISTVQPLQRAGRETVWIETTARALEMEGKWLIVTMARDISERKAAGRKAQLLFAAVNQAPDAIMIVDPETLEFIDFNEGSARMAGLTRDEMMRMGLRKMNDLGRISTEAELRERYDALIASHPRSETETREWHMPGQPPILLETTRRAVKVEGKWVIITVSRDVTERERAGQDMAAHVVELARSNRELEQFANVTSHDLSEPLRMVASFTQLLARRYHAQLDDEGREYIDYIVSGAQRMKQLIDDLLFYSKAGRPDAQTQCAPLGLALDAALENLAHAMADSNAVIRRPVTLPTLRYERTGMTQVFQNLVSNALKFRRANAPATVTITAQRSEAEWTIAIADNGIGVDPAYFDRIFVIFQRLHSREEYEGTGIGLAICEKIVERHGGRIWVEAAGPEGGACFKFTLPLQPSSTATS
ncbi:sensor histidine kinase [Hydrogenophaga sp. BPS33]|uniref:sensor histidine kinase n=1 Tax=Hydrogenophaga sp. BPS33 TaxID=2651974 RepID=UPI001F1DD792|nr:ATP-binding protein [Hydrogenophaga sp. BPS33]